eukprot:COSAG03_NODE_20859_length_312_cov_1.046948_1_plen_48_part_01
MVGCSEAVKNSRALVTGIDGRGGPLSIVPRGASAAVGSDTVGAGGLAG